MAEDEKVEDEKIEDKKIEDEKIEDQNVEEKAEDSADNTKGESLAEDDKENDTSEKEDSVENKENEEETDSSQKKENKDEAENIQKNNTENIKKVNINDIVGDESLPEIGGDLQDNKLNSKLKQLQRKRKNTSKKKKHKISTMLIIGTIVIGLAVMYFTTRDKEIKTNDNIVVELPTFAVNVYSEAEKNAYNIKMNVALSIDSKQIKNYNEEEAYNIIHETLSNMDYDDVAGDDTEQKIKEEIQYAIKEETKEHIDCKVYIAGTDPQKANLNGRTINTKADGEDKKASNISSKTTGK